MSCFCLTYLTFNSTELQYFCILNKESHLEHLPFFHSYFFFCHLTLAPRLWF